MQGGSQAVLLLIKVSALWEEGAWVCELGVGVLLIGTAPPDRLVTDFTVK